MIGPSKNDTDTIQKMHNKRFLVQSMYARALLDKKNQEIADHYRNVFEILWRRESGFASWWQADNVAEAIRPITEKGEVAAQVWERSTTVEETLPYLIIVYLYYVNGAPTNSAVYA